MLYRILEKCGINGEHFEGGEVVELHYGSVASALRLGLVEVVPEPEPEAAPDPKAKPKKAADPA